MKKSLKIIALSAVTLTFAGCASNHSSSELAELKKSVEDTRAAAIRAERNSQEALNIANNNSKQINNAWRKSQLK